MRNETSLRWSKKVNRLFEDEDVINDKEHSWWLFCSRLTSEEEKQMREELFLFFKRCVLEDFSWNYDDNMIDHKLIQQDDLIFSVDQNSSTPKDSQTRFHWQQMDRIITEKARWRSFVLCNDQNSVESHCFFHVRWGSIKYCSWWYDVWSNISMSICESLLCFELWLWKIFIEISIYCMKRYSTRWRIDHSFRCTSYRNIIDQWNF